MMMSALLAASILERIAKPMPHPAATKVAINSKDRAD
jgi:hypothetical protein